MMCWEMGLVQFVLFLLLSGHLIEALALVVLEALAEVLLVVSPLVAVQQALAPEFALALAPHLLAVPYLFVRCIRLKKELLKLKWLLIVFSWFHSLIKLMSIFYYNLSVSNNNDGRRIFCKNPASHPEGD